MSRLLTITKNGEELATLGARETKQISVTDDDGNFFKNLPGIEMRLHIGDKEYAVTMSWSEYQRMVEDGVITTERPPRGEG